MKQRDIGHSFDKLIRNTFKLYRGCRVEILSEGYRCLGIYCDTMDGVDGVIERAAEAVADGYIRGLNRLKK